MMWYNVIMKKVLSKKLPKAEREQYEVWCKKYGIDPVTNKLKVTPVGSVSKIPTINSMIAERINSVKKIKSIDSGITGAVATRSMMNPMVWRNESPEVVEAIKHKATCIAPAYNKGAAQYISAGTDPTDIGKKK